VSNVADHPAPAARATGACRSQRRRAPALCALLVAALSGSTAHAQDDASRAAARQLGAQGVEAFWANDFTTANDKLDRAFRIYATPTLGLWSGRARLKLGQLVEAAERFREATRASVVGDSDTQKKAQTEAKQELDKLTARIPSLTIQIQNADPSTVTVTLDGTPIPSALIGEPRPTNPGPHDLVARRGDEHYERHVQLAEGDSKRISLRFHDAIARVPDAPVEPPPPDSGGPVELGSQDPAPAAPRAALQPQRGPRDDSGAILKPLGIVAISLGAAGLVTSAATYLVARNKLDQCEDRVCDPDVKSSYDAMKAVSTVSLYAGAALAIGGVVLLVVAPSDEQESAGLRFGISPQGAAVHGRF